VNCPTYKLTHVNVMSLSVSQEQAAGVPPPIRSKHNTGPKGVIADYHEAKQALRERRAAERQQFFDKLAGKQERSVLPGLKLHIPDLVDEAALASDDDDSDAELMALLEEEDDEFLKDWAVKRYGAMLQNSYVYAPCCCAGVCVFVL
jgi:hypothetical protein